MCANYSELNQKKISNVCVYECMDKTGNKCGRRLKIIVYEYERCLFLNLWILNSF